MNATIGHAVAALAAIGALLAAPLAAQGAPVPPPVEQLTANCAAPVYATDQLVCGDPALKALDAELAAALAGFEQPASAWFEPHDSWFHRRSRCAFAEDHGACAAAAYRERLAAVRPPEPGVASWKARCSDRAVTAIAVSADRLVLTGENGRMLGVALADDARTSWKPSLAIITPWPHLRLAAHNGMVLDCDP